MNQYKDIESRADLDLIVEKFYDHLLVDEVVGFLFTEVVKLNLKEHLPRLVDFWEDQLFGTRNYSGNPMRVHLQLHQKSALEKEHFNRWLELFNQTIDSHFSGPKAHLAKERALSIATVMQIKVASI
ncbi:group III truncated hemoglobin [Flavobacteriales bacterium]|nr:group III truncated hemoglobin [Flavobacteriales bacterium]